MNLPTTSLRVAALCGALALAGCGGSSSKVASQGPLQPARQTPRQSNPDSVQVRTPSRSGRARVEVRVTRQVQHGRQTYATSRDDEHASPAKPFDPCRLVTLAQARALAGGSVTSATEAPLGPTCVYDRGASGTEITLAVEALTLSQAVHSTGKPQSVSVGGQHGYCVRSGTQAVFVPLSAGGLLQVTGPCAIAQRFAVRALTALAA